MPRPIPREHRTENQLPPPQPWQQARSTGREQSCREGGGEIVTDAQWQSLGDNGDDGGYGDDRDEDSCSTPFDNCPSFYKPAEAGVHLRVEEAPQAVEVGAASLSHEHGGIFAVTDNTCTGLVVSEGTGECTLIVEFSPQQPGRYDEQLAIEIPSHGVTHTIDLERDVSAPAAALPTAPTDSATGFTDPPARASPDPVPPGTGKPPEDPPDPQTPATDVRVGAS